MSSVSISVSWQLLDIIIFWLNCYSPTKHHSIPPRQIQHLTVISTKTSIFALQFSYFIHTKINQHHSCFTTNRSSHKYISPSSDPLTVGKFDPQRQLCVTEQTFCFMKVCSFFIHIEGWEIFFCLLFILQ